MAANEPSDQYLCDFILIPPVLFLYHTSFKKRCKQEFIHWLIFKMIFLWFRKKIEIINPGSFQSVVPVHGFCQESYQYLQTQCEAHVHNPGD